MRIWLVHPELFSVGALYGNSGNDSFVVTGIATSASTYGGAGNDSMTFAAAVNTLTYEGGIGADTLKVTGALPIPLSTETMLLQQRAAMTPSLSPARLVPTSMETSVMIPSLLMLV